MNQYRKRPVVIEAARVCHLLTDAQHNWSGLPGWVRAAYDDGTLLFADKYIGIATMEGHMRGEWDDWLIRGVKGELYPCKPDIFEATYEPADAPARDEAAELKAALREGIKHLQDATYREWLPREASAWIAKARRLAGEEP